MSSITEQISATSKSQLESQLNFLNSVLKNTVEGAGQIVALNLSTARNAAERSTAAARQLIEAKDSRAVLDLARPTSAIESLVAYQRELFSIASQTQQALLQTATDRLRAVPTKALALAVPAVAGQAAKIPETAVNAALAAANAASEAAQSVASGATGTAAHAAHAASDAAQAATASTVEAARAAASTVADAAAQTAAASADAAAKATQDAAGTAAKAGNDAVEVASDSIARAAEAAPAATDAVSEAVERVTDAAAEATPVAAPIAAAAAEPAASTAPLFDTEPSAPKTVRGKPATKPVAEALAALADNKPARSAPGKSRK